MTSSETQATTERVDADIIRAKIKATREQCQKDENLLDFVRGYTNYQTRIFSRGDYWGFVRAVDEYAQNWPPENTDSFLGMTFALYLGENRFFALTTAPLTEQTDGGFGQNNYLRWIAGTRDYSGASFLYENLKYFKNA